MSVFSFSKAGCARAEERVRQLRVALTLFGAGGTTELRSSAAVWLDSAVAAGRRGYGSRRFPVSQAVSATVGFI
ncbi:MAG TPA: hypothetical protein VM715_13600, partial [Candidatus Acidoferrum sp.]|nr:hypothetical protein [Candidatus Acidoferrum sp.]